MDIQQKQDSSTREIPFPLWGSSWGMVLDVESIEETLCSFHFIWIYVFSHALVLLGL